MTKFFLKNRVRRSISFTLLILFISEIVFPTASMALTNGPSQPEVQSFEPISTSDMVDVFTGDFKYNIPLLDVGGYPINMNYNSGVSMDQEASWVGLGWNLNVGTINRAMRGIPDDFKGETITKEMKLKPNNTFGINAGVDFELFGKESKKKVGSKKGKKFSLKPSAGIGIQYNNYTGFGIDLSVGVGISAGVAGKGMLDADLGLHSSANEGLEVRPNLSYTAKAMDLDKNTKELTTKSAAGKIGGVYNSRAGLKEVSFSAEYKKSVDKVVGLSPVYSGLSDFPVTTLPVLSNLSRKSKSAGGSVNFGLQTYVPNINMSMVNNCVSVSVKLGTHLFGSDANIKLSGFFSSNALASPKKSNRAYGYMYSEYGQDDPDAMMDFNREKDGSVTRYTKNLPITNFTYDVYNVTAQGSVGGAYRPFRSDVGHVFDNSSNSQSSSLNLGGELDLGNTIKSGFDATIVDVISTSGKWATDNAALGYFKFRDSSAYYNYEPYYFRQVGEKNLNPANNALYNALGGDEAYGVRLTQGFSLIANNSADIKSALVLEKNTNPPSNETKSLSGSNYIGGRQKRNQPFTILTKKEAIISGLQKNIYNGTGVTDMKGNGAMKIYSPSSGTIDHHISEINVLGTDGARYYYGMPVYNINQEEYSFNISAATLNSNGLINYTSTDASLGNSNGTDNQYTKVKTPAYAYSYLLTAIVSNDYVDQNGNGPDDADIGSYTKFHYAKASGSSSSTYKWQMPVDRGTYPVANFNEGSKFNTQDNTANFTYGEKELYYLDEIVTKNYVAKFITSDRKDSYGVTMLNGVVDGAGTNSKPQRLDKIVLYTKPEYQKHVSNNSYVPVPVKTVYFEYDYSLCGKVYNNNETTEIINSVDKNANKGKLTLKRIYFTYGKSNRAVFNSYDFTYSTQNPDYHPKASDRWGNYKPEVATIDYGRTAPRTNAEYPYSIQDPTNANLYANSWNLTKIKLPSGGEINVEYESDDYAFVQNMPAGQMFNVVSVRDTPSGSSVVNSLYSKNSSGGYDNNLYIIVDGIDASITSNADFKKYYLRDLNVNGGKKMFFKFLVNLTKDGAPVNNHFEFVSGYVNVEDGGLCSTAGQAWIKIKDEKIKKAANADMINPIALSAIQFGRLNYGGAVWDSNFNPPSDVEEALKQLANQAKGALKTLVTGFKNPNKALADKEYCKEVQLSKCQVRLYNAKGKKFGGGCRVKKLFIDDMWDEITKETANPSNKQAKSTYGQTYDYRTVTEFGDTISSGVASYEPFIGNEENSMKQPYYFGGNDWTLFAPDDRYYIEGPLGESFFPSASVGYAKITVRSIMPNTVLNEYKNGKKVYEFYTAKDYPTICKHTPIMPKQHKKPLAGLLKIDNRDYLYASQGYVVMTNDMHGKAKAELDYAYGKDKPEKEVRFFYKTRSGGYVEPTTINPTTDASCSKNILDNVIATIGKDGVAKNNLIGVDFDVVADFRESESNTTMVSTQNNLSTFLIGLIPAIIPSVWPGYQHERTRFRSSVVTKVVNQYAILEKTVVKDENSLLTSENLAFDAETGDVLVTRTTNDFDDPVYNVKYPSFWGYDLMGGAYKNVGVKFLSANLGQGLYAFGSGVSSDVLSVGDEILITSGSTNKKAWVCSVSPANFTLIDENGDPVVVGALSQYSTPVKVIRSGRRNQLSSQMAVLTCLNNPLPSNLVTGGGITINTSSQILNATGVVYSDQWQMPKGFLDPTVSTNCNCNLSGPGTTLIKVIKELFNKKNNAIDIAPLESLTNHAYYKCAFLNGALTVLPSLSSYPIQNGYGNNSHEWTAVWRDQTHTWTSGLWSYITKDYAPGTGTYDYGHYGVNSSSADAAFVGLLPYATNICGNTSSNANLNHTSEIQWYGPGTPANPNPFNSANQIIGCFREWCEATYCTVALDFGPNFVWSTALQNMFLGLAQQSNPNTVDIVPLAASAQTSCYDGSVLATFKILNSASVEIYSTTIKISSSCLNGSLLNCTNPQNIVNPTCGKIENQKVNPFFVGIKGNWRVKSNYTFLTDRTQTSATQSNMDIRKDGYFTSFTQLYSPNSGNDWTTNFGSGVNKWVNTVESTKYNQYGTEIETKDALGRYSSALYGYDDQYAIAVASNAQLQQIGYDGFEDYDFNYVCKKDHHFDFYPYKTSLDATTAHTGRYSLKVPAGQTYTLKRTVGASCNATNAGPVLNTPSYPCSYTLKCYDFILPFTPITPVNNVNNDYVFSYWVKEGYSGSQPLNYGNYAANISQGSGPLFAIKNLKKSAVIDGWQRIEYTFIIPNNYSGPIQVNLKSTASSNIYFDDIRIHPAVSNMKSYVYDPVNLRFVAELDANNFATLYEYDEQGNLVRVKKETERGIMTVKESKTHYMKP